MLTLDDAVALSVWYRGPRLRMLEHLRRGEPDLTLESVIDAVARHAAAGGSPEPAAAPRSHGAGVGPQAGHRRGAVGRRRLPGPARPDPGPAARALDAGRRVGLRPALGGHRRLPRRDALRPRGGVPAGRRPGGGRRAGGQRPRARRRFRRPPRRARGRWPDGGRPRVGRRRRLSARARGAGEADRRRRRRAERVAARHGAAARSISPRETASSAGSRWPWSWSRRPRRAGR